MLGGNRQYNMLEGLFTEIQTTLGRIYSIFKHIYKDNFLHSKLED